MKKIIIVLMANISGLLLGGCQGGDSTQVVSPVSHCAPLVSLSASALTIAPETIEAAETVPSMVLGAVHPELPVKRFIVKISDAARTQVRTQSLSEHLATDLGAGFGASPHLTQIDSGFYGLELESEQSSTQVAALLHAEDFDYVEPDFEIHETFVPNDPQLTGQWAHAVVQSAKAWDISRGASSVTVAVLDSGSDPSHPDLAKNIWVNPNPAKAGDGSGYDSDVNGWNFASNTNNIVADDVGSFHGTHVSGTIGAVGNNSIGISGHAQVVKLMPLKFISSNGSGYTSDAVRGIDYAIAHKARIINNSWGSGFDSQALSDAINRARSAGILFVAAAGNDGANNDATPFYPASYPYDNIVRVAATDSADHLASWSNYGAAHVDIAAPGVNILSTKNGNAYQYLSGTSMATPLISGVLATMVALRPDLSYLQIKAALLNGVDHISALSSKTVSGGRVNSYNALASIQQGTTDSAGNCIQTY